jgi:replicative DNA helicase
MNQSTAQQVLELTHPTAETTVLTAMRRGATEDAVYLADTLSSGDFADPRRRVVFQAMVNVLRSTEPLDDTAILAECPQVARDMRLDVRIDGGWLAGLDGDPLRARAYAQTVKRLAYLRSGADFAFWFVNRLQERADPDQLFTEAQERIQALQPPSKTQRFVYGWDTVQAHRAEIAQRQQDAADGRINPFLWPWASWNHSVRPLRPGMLGLVAAADGVGKSTYLEMIAEHWALGGMHVVYVHLEDALDYKLDRRLARWARVPLQALEDGTTTAEQRQAADVAQEKIDRNLNTLHYFDAAGMSAAEIVTELKARVGEGVCQAVVLDYLDKMQPSRAQAKLYGDQIWERQSNDVEVLKTFAEKNKLPIMTASQGNKGMQSTTGTRTRKDISGSGAKTQKAQMVAILTREMVGDDGLWDDKGVSIAAPGEYSPFINVRIDKQNRGKTGVTMQQFLIGQYFDIRDMDIQRVQLEY